MAIERPYLRDGVDVYVRGDDEIHFVFLATRKRLVLKVAPSLIQALAWLDGESSGPELSRKFEKRFGEEACARFLPFLEYLETKGIVVERDWLLRTGLGRQIVATQERQLNFFLDLLGSPLEVLKAHDRILRSRITLFGTGAVGSWILRLLLGLGFRHFTIVDHDQIESADISRHAFLGGDDTLIGGPKAQLIAQRAQDEFADVVIRPIVAPLSFQSDLAEFIAPETTLVINTADQPYIGYTSVLLSRYCLTKRLPLLVAGGFDAHLGSLGEMIVPGATPCADCYADYFKESLAEWNPYPHPVESRSDGFGGLCSLSVFSASAAAMKALRLVALDERAPVGGRGELLFEDYQLDSFVVERRADCAFCGDL